MVFGIKIVAPATVDAINAGTGFVGSSSSGVGGLSFGGLKLLTHVPSYPSTDLLVIL
ncbi:hypothetical protein P5G62_007890 [Neobacillus sp. 179-C4.2 HS]|uniref:Uncharacterized protein n=1 Tax=Neobacillus driksii TaxID=3035913 RepID=A0ABV4YQ94_9BACI|nr:hypothetical protein [Neobacillus sp. 179.-C4.2 HS]